MSVDDPSTNDVPTELPPSINLDDFFSYTKTSTLDDGDDLIPLTSLGPNIFYGFREALLDLFEYGEEQGPYWIKSMVLERYKYAGDRDNVELETGPLSYAGITSYSDSKSTQTPEANLLSTYFHNLSGDWYEVTVKREKPVGMGMQVKLVSSKFKREGNVRYIRGGQYLGGWWISDIRVATGESQKAIETVLGTMF